jgi:response regulator RpfG family c-di-GMP phosphodiesterase
VGERILMVDDEPRVLDGVRRTLHGRYSLDTAHSGQDGLARIDQAEQPYAVVLSDMMMPVMNGAEFLAAAHVASPDSVQMILSGQAELTSTIAAVNEGNLFRFLTKPCAADELARALDAALQQYRLIHAERELLQRTLDGTVELLTDLMKVTNPMAAARTEQVRAIIEAITPPSAWEARIAAMLGQVGLLATPPEVLSQVRQGGQLDAETIELYRTHPRLAHDLVRRIPRLERVAAWIAAQPVTPDEKLGDDIDDDQLPYATATAFVVGIEAGRRAAVVAAQLTGYPSDLVKAVHDAYQTATVRKPRKVSGAELTVGMVVDQDVMTRTGLMLVRSGELLSESMAVRLRHFAAGVGVEEPIAVLV